MTEIASEHAALPYRPCVGVVLLNAGGLVFAGQRIDNPGDAWQMPQGGIDPGEDPRSAALRELEEETGIGASLVSELAVTRGWHRYDLPPELLGKIWGGKYRGQEQLWYAMRFLGADSDVAIETEEPEFSRWTWMPAAELATRIVPFKRPLYREVFAEFSEWLA